MLTVRAQPAIEKRDCRGRAGRMARRQNREQSPLSNPVAETPPNNLIREEPSYPNHKANRAAHRNEPQNLCELPIAQAPRSGYPRQAHAKKEIRQKIGNSYRLQARRKRSRRSEQSPRQSVREYKAAVAQRSHALQAYRPTQFMLELFPNGLVREDHRDRLRNQFHTVAASRDALAQLKIVRLIVDHRFPPTDIC